MTEDYNGYPNSSKPDRFAAGSETDRFAADSGTGRRLCKRCLLRELNEDELYQTMAEYIARMEPDIKTEDTEYERRLKLCKECEKLLQGMCRACGCYVEMRAAVRAQSCPDVTHRW